MKRCMIALSVLAASALACLAEDAYEDDYVVSSSSPSLKVYTKDGIAYGFVGTEASVDVQLKVPMTLTRRLIVGGGGAGGWSIGGGGGGGGVIPDETDVLLEAESVISLTAGIGGHGGSSDADPSLSGGDSSLTVNDVTQTAFGGGHGGSWGAARSPADGGSGGGGSGYNNLNSKGVDGQGYRGGATWGAKLGAAGGGGATSVGANSTDGSPGNGGKGLENDITGVMCTYGSGGGGGYGTNNSTPAGLGGTNAGDGGAKNTRGGDAIDGFGGGGGGGDAGTAGGNGGDGIVVVTLRPDGLVGVNYSDAALETTDGSVKVFHTAEGVAYAFSKGTSQVRFKTPVRILRKLVVAGGGGGGYKIGGGGGGGGVISDDTAISVAEGGLMSVTVGAGGVGQAEGVELALSQGEDSILAVHGVMLTAKGGGYGGNWGTAGSPSSGGSGGGQSGYNATMGAGVSGQGNGGGASNYPGPGTGGGGGAASVGANGTNANPGNGGEGVTNDITGVACVYGSGGGGGYGQNSPNPAGIGGTNAGDGGTRDGENGEDAVDGFGGGGGGSGQVCAGGAGGDGAVIILVAPENGGILYVESAAPVKDGQVTPAVGFQFLADAETLTCSAQDDVDAEVGVAMRCTGYTFETAAGGVWGTPTEGEQKSVDYVQDGAVICRLTWQWNVEPTTIGFQDRFISTSATGVKRYSYRKDDVEKEVVYVFAKPGAGCLVLKNDADLLERLIVGGGGAGGWGIGGGGGGGGVIKNESDLSLSAGSVISLSVGAGGRGGTSDSDPSLSGEDSTLTVNGVTQTAVGGGCGGSWGAAASRWPADGGSGGGQSGYNDYVSKGVEGQGYRGGATYGAGTVLGSAGGGGASGIGSNGFSDMPGNGGEGIMSFITGVAQVYGSGGGGGYGQNTKNPAGVGGTNAGDGGAADVKGEDAVDGFGGGGGGSGNVVAGGKGGDGAVILRFRVQDPRRGLGVILR